MGIIAVAKPLWVTMPLTLGVFRMSTRETACVWKPRKIWRRYHQLWVGPLMLYIDWIGRLCAPQCVYCGFLVVSVDPHNILPYSVWFWRGWRTSDVRVVMYCVGCVGGNGEGESGKHGTDRPQGCESCCVTIPNLPSGCPHRSSGLVMWKLELGRVGAWICCKWTWSDFLGSVLVHWRSWLGNQGGSVTAMAINQGVLLAFTPSDTQEVTYPSFFFAITLNFTFFLSIILWPVPGVVLAVGSMWFWW